MSAPLSQWTTGIEDHFSKPGNRKPVPLNFIPGKIEESIDSNSLWVILHAVNGYKMAIRTCFDPQGIKIYTRNIMGETVISYLVQGSIGSFDIRLEIVDSILRYTTQFIPAQEMSVKAFPRDIYILDNNFNPLASEGTVHTLQAGPAAGIAYFSIKPKRETILYFQNLTSLNDYFQETETVPDNIVSAQWPEIGTALPESKKPLKKIKPVILSDALINFAGHAASGEVAQAQFFIDGMAEIYRHIKKPKTVYFDWPDMASKAIHSLADCKDCYRQINNHTYLNAYVASAEKPPESMVQYTLLIPMMEYQHWFGKPFKITAKLFENVLTFFDKKQGVMTRWLAGTEFKKDKRSEEEYHEIMDSWYLFHILGNVGRLALAGHVESRKNFLSSAEYAIKAAKKFSYNWPVFFHYNTLKIIKAETGEGKGGEQDVNGVYARVMWQAFQLTKEKRFLKEAEKALGLLRGKGFSLLYQTNNTAMTAVTALELWQHTNNKAYLDLSIVCIANVISKMWMWDCNFNYGRYRSTFMGVLPLHDAPYLAAYEEAEVFAIFSCFLKTGGEDLSPSIHLLLSEYMKYVLYRGRYYYPSELPSEMINNKPKEGKIIRNLPIPLEDLQTGWKKSGEVGQEIYGSNLPFILSAYAYQRFDKVPFTLYCEYPVLKSELLSEDGQTKLTITIGGVDVHHCQMRLIPEKKSLPASLIVKGEGAQNLYIKGHRYREYMVKGGAIIEMSWKNVK